MPFPVSGSPSVGTVPTFAYAGRFIPAVWSGKLMEKFYDSTVLSAITNTDYEGEIQKFGDTVHVRTRASLTIRDYTADGALVYERPSSDIIDFVIDKGKYFGTVLDDVIKVQSDMDLMGQWADDAAEQLKIVIDTAVLASIPAGVVAANKGQTAGRKSLDIKLGVAGTPLIVTKSGANNTTQKDILDLIVDMGTVLDEQNIPATGRWIVMPIWAGGLLMKSDLRNASITGDATSPLRNGRLGEIDRFTLYTSNLLPTATEGAATASHIFAGTSHGLTFASQLTELETLRVESTFGTIMRGLQVYGHKVMDGIALVDAYVVKG
jgi:hypothetical protein